jgi:hypothetical protein
MIRLILSPTFENYLHGLGIERRPGECDPGFIGVVVIAPVMLVLDISLVWVERKVVAFAGPPGTQSYRAFRIDQPVADIIKR